ncbi:MAG TPA: M48 family metallopeptidase [Candidatus Paceibacterota bacterium]|nr:M48 family metallopeptidase [Candidatus Paceibacterota bacterium]
MRRGTRQYKTAVKAARELATERVKHFNAHYAVRHTSITIRKQRTRWGSASTRGTLSFNYRIVHLPPELIDYIIVHELCHLIEMNHSQRFWARVAETIPHWKEHRKALRRSRF